MSPTGASAPCFPRRWRRVLGHAGLGFLDLFLRTRRPPDRRSRAGEVDAELLRRAQQVVVLVAHLGARALLGDHGDVERQRLHLLQEHLEALGDRRLGDVLALDDRLLLPSLGSGPIEARGSRRRAARRTRARSHPDRGRSRDGHRWGIPCDTRGRATQVGSSRRVRHPRPVTRGGLAARRPRACTTGPSRPYVDGIHHTTSRATRCGSSSEPSPTSTQETCRYFRTLKATSATRPDRATSVSSKSTELVGPGAP